jgi:hypothetical protein
MSRTARAAFPRTRGDIWNEVERGVAAACGDKALCAECRCTFGTFSDTCPLLATDRAFTCEGWLAIAAAYDHAQAALPAEDQWAVR